MPGRHCKCCCRFLQRLKMTLPELPKDLVEEILCLVPATSLKRLRSTCKRWNRLFIDDKRFARKHTDKAAKQFLPLMLTKNYRICPINVNTPSLEVKNELSLLDPHCKNSAAQFNIDRVFHCDGLLLCTSQKESRFVVWNPLTGVTKWIELGDRYNEGMAFVLGYDNKSCNKSYKILSFNFCNKDSEIYEFSSDSWRVIDDIKPRHYLEYSRKCVSLKGNTYWFGIDRRRRLWDPSMALLEFDFGTEKFGYVPLPRPCQVHGFEASNLSVVRDEKLSVLLEDGSTSKTEVWVTNKIGENNVVSWSKVLALYPRADFWHGASCLLDEEKKVVLCCKSKRWMEEGDKVYIVGEDNKVKIMDSGVYTIEGSCPTILNYIPSLVQIERAGGKRKRGD
ncbi:F-box domain [Arabidopsis thaliana x Arabidopsis arenosa]|uniref:F-box domain n=1 Tax=Arabidopsis thaliana x Arabidopsis arenosa TaxID=1240361 RepID=A0A8T2ASY6_9BRAS|nr:F-box domain [Arabidopsis thaliana x Arabidopsis arenosa]